MQNEQIARKVQRCLVGLITQTIVLYIISAMQGLNTNLFPATVLYVLPM